MNSSAPRSNCGGPDPHNLSCSPEPWKSYAAAAVLALLGLALSPQPASAQQDLIFGAWKVNAAKTAHPPKSETRTYEDRGGGLILSTRQGVDAQGQEYFSQYAAKHDGKPYPRMVKGVPGINTISFQQIDPYTSTYTLRTNGTVTATGKTTISHDGRVLTVETASVEGGLTTVEVYDRQ